MATFAFTLETSRRIAGSIDERSETGRTTSVMAAGREPSSMVARGEYGTYTVPVMYAGTLRWRS